MFEFEDDLQDYFLDHDFSNMFCTDEMKNYEIPLSEMILKSAKKNIR